MRNSFEKMPSEELTSEEKFELAKKRHPNQMSAKDKMVHGVSEAGPVQNWLEDRAEMMVERSGINEVIEEIDGDVMIVEVGGGKGHIGEETAEANPDKEIKTVGVDISDYASGRISESGRVESVFGRGENLPIKNESVEIATAYFTFQELNDNQQKDVLEEMKRIIKENGRIVVTDELPQEETSEGVVARAKNILRNIKMSKFNIHNDEEWRRFFEDNDLEVESSVIFGEDKENKKEQFISYVLKKAEETESVE